MANHITTPTMDQASYRVDELALREHQNRLCIPSVPALFEDSNTSIPALENTVCISLNDISNNVNLSDKLFCIQFTLVGTIHRQWYLIQVDIESTMEANPKFISNKSILVRLPSKASCGR